MNEATNMSVDSGNERDRFEMQMDSCLSAIKQCDRSVRKRHWDKLVEVGATVSCEMETLKLLLLGFSNMDEAMLNRLRYLDIQMRRTQRQLTLHLCAVESDISILGHGIKKTEAIRTMLVHQPAYFDGIS